MDSHRALLVINILQAVLLTLLFGYLGALHLEGAKTLGNLANSTQDIHVALTFDLLRQVGNPGFSLAKPESSSEESRTLASV